MSSRGEAPLGRPITRSRARSLADRGEEDLHTRLDEVPLPEVPQRVTLTDPNPVAGSSSRLTGQRDLSEETVKRFCDDSVNPLEKRLAEQEGNASANETRL